ncbi:MAG: phosphatase PAP2 family protein [Lachnospiraceae bacterium]|nr:phosphatase PAP2 family protein [Lachnospiraceae bacterium]
MVIYLTWFFIIESHVNTYMIIHTSLDDKIPFCEFFVIPYYIWFGYVVACVMLAFFTDLETYWKTVLFLVTGMTIFLVISTLWPNGQNLRPLVFERDNLCTGLVEKIYSADTPTNLWPSIHVYNSIGSHLCIMNCSATKNKKWARAISFVTAILIILSTMFIKQHSCFDVTTAIIMAIVMTLIVYYKEIEERISQSRVKREEATAR